MKRRIKLKAIEATPENFAEYGQIIEPTDDGDGFGPQDAQLDLSKGTPRVLKSIDLNTTRFYILHIENRPFNFSRITHHASVTQCLGSIDRHSWYLGVAKPSIVDDEAKNGIDVTKSVLRSKSGHLFVPPWVDEIQVFRISGAKFVKLNKGTWHAGPLFRESARDFYNLELSNTNVVDHTSYNLGEENGVLFDIED